MHPQTRYKKAKHTRWLALSLSIALIGLSLPPISVSAAEDFLSADNATAGVEDTSATQGDDGGSDTYYNIEHADQVTASAHNGYMTADEIYLENIENLTLEADNVELTLPGTYVDATILRSLNARNPFCRWTPDVDDVVDIIPVIRDDNHLAFIYPRVFNEHKVERRYESFASRENAVLDDDILVKEEHYEFTTDVNLQYSALLMTDYDANVKGSGITFGDANMAIKKATGHYKVNCLYNFVQSEKYHQPYEADEYQHLSDKVIPIGSTPMVDTLTMENTYVYAERYYCDVFVTRTLSDVYWTDAVNDGTVLDGNYAKVITKADFCEMLANYLHIYGEPVLNNSEMEMLLVAHGKTLPYYLPSNQVDAVKYLLARGILYEPIEDYTSPLTCEELMLWLARAVDKSARMDFKKVDVPYNSELVSDGYYPTNALLTTSPIQDLQISTESEVAKSYDYLILKDETTTFRDVETGQEVTQIYVSQKYDDVSAIPCPGTDYKGTVTINGNTYYHFVIDCDIKEQWEASGYVTDGNKTGPVQSGCVSINSYKGDDQPGDIKVKLGGGVYTNRRNGGHMTRERFPSDFPEYLIDEERKKEAQELKEEGEIFLADAEKKTTFKFTVPDSELDKVLWEGKKLSDAKEIKSLGDEQYEVQITAADPQRILMKNLTYNVSSTSVKMVPAYVVNGTSALLSVEWLRHNNLISDCVEMEKGVYMLYGKYDNICVDINNRLIIAGQVVYQIPESDPSPLVVNDVSSGQTLIDYRAVTSATMDYLIVKDDNGNITLSVYDTPKQRSTKFISPLMGMGRESIRILKETKDKDTDADANTTTPNDISTQLSSGQLYINLEQTSLYSNWLIYKVRNGSVNKDYIVTFRPSNIESPNTAEELDAIEELFGLKPRAYLKVSYREIGETILTDSGTAGLVKRVLRNKKDGQYYYKVPMLKDVEMVHTWFDWYMSTQADSYPTGIIALNGELIDMNTNLIKHSLDLKTYNSSLQNKYIKPSILQGDPSIEITGNDIIPTAVGVYSSLFPERKYTWQQVIELKNKQLLYGSMALQIRAETSDAHEYVYTLDSVVNGAHITSINQAQAGTTSGFVPVFRGTTNIVLAWSNITGTQLADSSSLLGNVWKDITDVADNGLRNVFDWMEYAKRERLNALNDILNVGMLSLLSVGTRILEFIFFLFAALSLCADNRLMNMFCSKIVDPFYLLTGKRRTIDTVTAQDTWINVALGWLMLSMLYYDSIFGIVGWFTDFIINIIQ